MKIKYFQVILVALMAISIVSFMFMAVPVSYAQSSRYWSKPINLSNAGSSTNPVIIIDPEGTTHVIWIDQFEGYKYTKSADGVNWTSPESMRFPFSPKDDSEPVLLADQEGGIHALWQDKSTTALYHSKAVLDYDLSSNWTGRQKLADSVIAFDAVLSSKGILHLGFVSSILDSAGNPRLVGGRNVNPTGVYYRQFKGNGWSKLQGLYSSQYFRSLKPEDANIHLAVSEENEMETVHMVWDDRPQKRILWAKSLDGGNLWENASQVRVSEAGSGLGTLFNINVGIVDGKLLLLWQSGTPGSQCTLFSQRLTDSSDQFGSPVKLFDNATGCPEVSKFMILNKDFAVIQLNVLDDISLVAWNGSDWSKPETQNEITTFTNPSTLDGVILGCQRTAKFGGRLFVVGCDKANGGDIWFSSRSLGTVEDWFPPSSAWTGPIEVTSIDQQISELASVADSEDSIHSFWIQDLLLPEAEAAATIQYAQWNRENWSSPKTILSEFQGSPKQLTVQADGWNRLLLAWVDSKTGDMFFTWAAAEHAGVASEWQTPQYIPSISQANSSPDILVDHSGKIVVAYAIPINEGRGIYLVESDDGGMTWTQPFKVFDAESAGWDIVDQPNIGLTGDGRLHVLFKRYSFQGETRSSLGLYYAQSIDGGVVWTEPTVVSEYPVPWSEIAGYDKSILHRFWQEYRQSDLVSFHQISMDNGLTWGTPVIVSNLNAESSLTTQTIDKVGNIYFLQMTQEENLINIGQRMWNGSSWITQEPLGLYIQDQERPFSIAAGVSSRGHMLVSILMDDTSLNDQFKSDIISVGKAMDLPEEVQTPYPAIIPVAEPMLPTTEGLAGTLQVPTQSSSVLALNDSPSTLPIKNLIGILLLGGTLALIIIVFWPLSKKQTNQKKISE